jgi:PhnB protein
MAKAKQPIPEGLYTLTPNLVVKGAAQALDFYKKAFGATELSRMPGPNGVIMHASMRIGNSVFFINDEIRGQGDTVLAPPTIKGTTTVLNLYVADCDKIYDQAIAAGARETMPLTDQFWGDRYGQVADPYGHVWAIATRKEDLTPAELESRGREFASNMAAR